jgi:hypothetical protein
MKVPAILTNNSTNSISTDEIDELLQKKALLAFHRSDGWVMVGVDEMRDPRGRRGSSWKDRKILSREGSLKQA